MATAVQVLKSEQKGQVVYIGYLTADEARKLTFSDHYPPNTSGRLGYQRPPEVKRAQAFADYYISNPAGFITPILLNARTKLEFCPTLDGSYGYIRVPEDECLAVVDGQHRTLGIINWLDPGTRVPFMLFDSLDTGYEQDLFITINREQKKVSMSHVNFVGRKGDRYAELAVKLESDPESPWHGRVNLVGARGTKRPVSLQSLRSSLEELLQSGEVKVLTYEVQYQLIVDYWKAVSAVWNDAWNAPKGTLIKKSMGTLALSKLGGYLIPRCLEPSNNTLDVNKLTTFLQRAKNINWRSDGDFRGFSGRHGADLVKDKLDALIFRRDD